MLDNGVTMLVCEDREVILCAQVRLILRSLLVTCECVVFHTQGHKTLMLEVPYGHSHIDLYEVRIGDDVLVTNERRIESIEIFSDWESRVFHSGLVVRVRS